MFAGSDRHQKIDQSVVLFQELLIAAFHSSLRILRNWEDARLKQSLSHVFQQRRGLLPAYNRFVRGACFLFSHQSAGQFFAVDR